MFTPKRAARIGSRLSLGSPRQSPSLNTGNNTVPVQISELLKEGHVEGHVLNCGFACVTQNDTIFAWKVNQKSQVFQIPAPAGCHCQASNFALVGASGCFISPTGIGRFWPSISIPTKWLDFSVTLDSGDSITCLHADVSKIGAVSKAGCLYTITVANDVVSANVHRLPSNQGQGSKFFEHIV